MRSISGRSLPDSMKGRYTAMLSMANPTLPASKSCNAGPVPFPAVPAQASVKFHERTAPAGAVPSADVSGGRPPDMLIVIHNARAAGTVVPAAPRAPAPTPTPTPIPTPTPTPAPTSASGLVKTGAVHIGPIGFVVPGLALISMGALLYWRRRRRIGP